MTIITRKAWDSWGEMLQDGRRPLPPNVSHIEILDYGYSYLGCEPKRRLVTWDEVLENRREIQKKELERKRHPDKCEFKPCYIWVFDNGNIFPYGGRWCYIKTFKNSWALNFRDERKDLQLKLMEIFPCGFLPLVENFDSWMVAFMKNYPVNGKRKRDGRAIAWAEIYNGRLLNIRR